MSGASTPQPTGTRQRKQLANEKSTTKRGQQVTDRAPFQSFGPRDCSHPPCIERTQSHLLPWPPWGRVRSKRSLVFKLTRRRRSSPPPRLSPSACWLPFVFPVSPYDQPYSSYSAPICSNLGLSWPIRLGLASIWGSMQARGLWIRLVWVDDFLGSGLRIGALIRWFCD
jgi:hypothetical protein